MAGVSIRDRFRSETITLELGVRHIMKKSSPTEKIGENIWNGWKKQNHQNKTSNTHLLAEVAEGDRRKKLIDSSGSSLRRVPPLSRQAKWPNADMDLTRM